MCMIINHGGDKPQTFNVPSYGLVTLNNLQKMDEDGVLGKLIKKHFPNICKTEVTEQVSESTKEVELPVVETKVVEPQLEIQQLNEDPICVAEVETEEDIVEESTEVELKPLSDFETKDSLEEYGLTFGIDLNKRKSLPNMYKELIASLKDA